MEPGFLNKMTMPVPSPAQCRAARALLYWTQLELARRSRVSRKTIIDFEMGQRVPKLRTLLGIARTLESAGVEFTWANGSDSGPAHGGIGEGLRLVASAR